ncbi:hypothetical protein [Leptospira sarikeiensis]|uniref:Uncharacterized protein n=1 Tax=Leptospira sarikeiensis TaxID=2484943 RepID=A0A4R9JZG1_9LEPT|nr:hypothetical protein [Leptospira sarikeiensis]TGL58779.1 hypothetical protein EHQ64_17170 [Leptospira sarikeiensis]
MKPKANINIESSLLVTIVASLGFLFSLGIAPVKTGGFVTDEPVLRELIQDQFSWEPSSEQIRDLPERTAETGPSLV